MQINCPLWNHCLPILGGIQRIQTDLSGLTFFSRTKLGLALSKLNTAECHPLPSTPCPRQGLGYHPHLQLSTIPPPLLCLRQQPPHCQGTHQHAGSMASWTHCPPLCTGLVVEQPHSLGVSQGQVLVHSLESREGRPRERTLPLPASLSVLAPNTSIILL